MADIDSQRNHQDESPKPKKPRVEKVWKKMQYLKNSTLI